MLRDLGFAVAPFDLYPFQFKVDGLECRKADLSEGLPQPDSSADYLVCEEGIEHIPDQLALMREFSRVLRIGGTLFVTTPNISCLRSKASNLFNESEYFRRLPPSELDAVWFSEGSEKLYYGHLFLINFSRMCMFARLNGFELVRAHPNKVNWPSVLLSPLWPLLAISNLEAAFSESLRRRKQGFGTMWRTYSAIALRNLSPSILFCKHLFVEFRKVADADEAARKLRGKHHEAMESMR